MPEEQIPTTDTVEAAVKQAKATSELDENWLCDICHNRMSVTAQMVLNDQPHEVRTCTANPQHQKTVPL